MTILFISRDAFGSVRDCFLQLDKTSGIQILPERVDPNGTSPQFAIEQGISSEYLTLTASTSSAGAVMNSFAFDRDGPITIRSTNKNYFMILQSIINNTIINMLFSLNDNRFMKGYQNIIVKNMKVFDIGELKKTAKLKQFDPSRSYSEIHKSPLKSSIQENAPHQSYFLSRWGKDIQGKVDPDTPWINVGQGIYSVATGQEHVLILNNKNQCFAYGSNSYGQLSSEGSFISRPSQITSFKDMKIVGIYCGAYHSFVQNSKGEIFCFGLNMKGQLGIGNFDNKKKPTLVYSLLPNGQKNPRSSFFIETNQYKKKSKKYRDENAELNNITNLFEKYEIQEEEEKSTSFLLYPEETVIKLACGPLHTIALTNRNRIFTCGYGEKFSLGTGKSMNSNEFVQAKLKSSQKIEKIEAGIASTGYLANGRAYICGSFGDKVFETFTQMGTNDDFSDMKLGEKSAIFLTRKGDVYIFGEYFRENGDRLFTQSLKKIDKLSNIRYISGGVNSFFCVSDNKAFYGWGENENNQITASREQPFIFVPKSIKVPIYLNDNINIVSYNGTTFLLSSKPLETDYEKYVALQSSEKAAQQDDMPKIHKKSSSANKIGVCGAEEKNMLEQMGIHPRIFNNNMEIDINQLTFDYQISEGGYGIIYKGTWRDTVVAIKKFKVQSEAAVKDFFSQCAAMEALRHPNVVLFLGACTKPPNLCIVLEYCSRGSLWSTIQNLDIPLSWEDRRRFALDTARGVNYLHTCSPPIIHRDLKSLNLLLDDCYKVKLADFGWTKGLENYMTGKIGTYQWMAPEVIASQKYSEKADVFSYGIILWEIASREPPFKHLTGLQVSIEVLNNDMRPPIPKKTPEPFIKLMKRCWDRDPSKRPSFKEIIKQLQTMKL